MSSFRYKTSEGAAELQFEYDSQSETLSLNGKSFRCDGKSVDIAGRRVPFWTRKTTEQLDVWLDGQVFRFDIDNPHQRGASADKSGPAGGSVKAQMPGKILQISVKVGDKVEPEQNLLLMESMKMELALDASVSGTVSKVEVEVGQMVSQGQLLVEISEDEA